MFAFVGGDFLVIAGEHEDGVALMEGDFSAYCEHNYGWFTFL